MKNVRELAGVLYCITVIVVSFIALDAAKFDTAERIWLITLIGSSTILLPVFFGFHGIKNHPYFSAAVFFWILWMALSFIFSPIKNYGFSEVLMYSWAGLFGVFVSGISEPNKKHLFRVLLAGGVISCLYGFWYFPLHGEARMAGLFFDAIDARHFFPNAFATFIVMTWPLLIDHGPKKKSIRVVLASIFLASLYLTFSRGAWAAFGFQLIFLIPIALRNKRATIKIIASTVLLTTLFITALLALRQMNFSTISLQDRLSFANGESRTSVNERKDFWEAAVTLTKNHPLLGNGPMSFRYVYPPLQKHFLGASDHPHNWFLKISSENGLPALLAFILFIGIALSVTYRNFKNDSARPSFSEAALGRCAASRQMRPNQLMPRQSEATVKYTLFIAWGGGLLHSMVDFNMNFVPTILAFFILIGATLPSEIYVPFNLPTFRKFVPWIGAFIITAITITSLSELVIAVRARTVAADSLDAIELEKKSRMPRDFFRTLAEKKIAKNERQSGNELLDIHLGKNPLDAFAWYLKGDAEKAIRLDPENRLAYYRLYIETHPHFTKAKDMILAKLNSLLREYDDLLVQNIYYTAFTDNAFEAARIYDLLGKPQKAQWIRSTTDQIKKKTAEEQHFNEQIRPRTLRELFFKKSM